MPGPEPTGFRETIQHHSKSFSFASTLLPGRVRRDVEVLYAWCRRADDAIDLAPPARRPEQLDRLQAELDAIYDEAVIDDALGAAMQELVGVHGIPRTYPVELLAGMDMDVRRVDYADVDTLLLYGYRVAGTVGLMMSHVIGVREPSALQHAVHLGIAMQLTNICRDVREDWDDGRLYLPHDLLERHGGGALPDHLGSELPVEFRGALGAAVRDVLDLADVYYASADRGLRDLPWRPALGVRTARLVYADIGSVIRRRECDVFGDRAYVPGNRKYVLGARAVASAVGEIPFRARHRFASAPLESPVRFPDDVVILDVDSPPQPREAQR